MTPNEQQFLEDLRKVRRLLGEADRPLQRAGWWLLGTAAATLMALVIGSVWWAVWR